MSEQDAIDGLKELAEHLEAGGDVADICKVRDYRKPSQMSLSEALQAGEKLMKDNKTLWERTGYWRSAFDNGYFELTCPMALNEIDLEYFNHVIEGIKRQVNRWSTKHAEVPSTPTPKAE